MVLIGMIWGKIMIDIILFLFVLLPIIIMILMVTFWICLDLYEGINSKWEKIHRKNYCVRCGKTIPKNEKYCSKCYVTKCFEDGVKE